MKAAFLSVAAAVMFIAAGCAGGSGDAQCDRVCAQYNACALEKRAFDFDCINFCGEVVKQEKAAAKAMVDTCSTQWDAYLTCWDQNNASICSNEFKGCVEAHATWATCAATYCASHKSTGICGDNGTPTLPAF